MSWWDRFRRRGPETQLDADLLRRIRGSFEEAAADEEHFPSTIDPRIWHVQLILRYFGGLQGQRVLDLGCGKGRFARILHESGAHVVALDLAESMLRAAPAELMRVSATMTAVPFGDGVFDAAYATESLEHAVDIELAVAEMCRVVRRGGKIVIIDKNAEHWGRLETPEWEKWFRRGELEKLLKRHCSEVSSQLISYWEDVPPDGLFVAWTARR